MTILAQRLATATLMALVCLMTLVGCAKPPEKALADAEKALREAVVVSECAEEEFKEAEEMLAEAKRLVEKGEYDKAEAKAKAAKSLADRARKTGEDRWKDCQDAKNKPVVVEKTPDDIDSLLKNGRLAAVYFDYNESVLTEPTQKVLQKNAEWMRRNPGAQITIEGHCDERGTTEFNISLGERRAQTVRKYLVQLGIDGSRLKTVSYGSEMPAVVGNSDTSHDKNRRAEFAVTQ